MTDLQVEEVHAPVAPLAVTSVDSLWATDSAMLPTTFAFSESTYRDLTSENNDGIPRTSPFVT